YKLPDSALWGQTPGRLAGAGESGRGYFYAFAGAAGGHPGAPLDPLIMEEGGGWDMDAAAILRVTRNLDAAQRLADWSASQKANELYGRSLALVARKGVSSAIPFYPEGVENSMIRNDLAWAAANRARILAEWQRRYDGKSERK
ncbi:MAG: putative 2-aminoethylphosphonate ABC transporter substrate-binding protein, partial [Pseudomonadota bacterium]